MTPQQSSWMTGYIEGFSGRPAIVTPEAPDLPSFLSGHSEGKAAREQVSNTLSYLGDHGTGPSR